MVTFPLGVVVVFTTILAKVVGVVVGVVAGVEVMELGFRDSRPFGFGYSVHWCHRV